MERSLVFILVFPILTGVLVDVVLHRLGDQVIVLLPQHDILMVGAGHPSPLRVQGGRGWLLDLWQEGR